jgi:hypothetical protein
MSCPRNCNILKALVTLFEILLMSVLNEIGLIKKKVKLSHYMPWRHMRGEEV